MNAAMDDADVSAATGDVRALLRCGVPLERLLAIRPHGLSPAQIHELAKAWLASPDAEQCSHSLGVAGAVLGRSVSALKDPDVSGKILESLAAAPDELLDPLFYNLMQDPVVLSSGIVVDRSTALDANGNLNFSHCPFTRQALDPKVYPHLLLKDRLNEFAKIRLEQLFTLIETSLAHKQEDGLQDCAVAMKAAEIGCTFLKEVGKGTHLKEAERMNRLRIQILELTQEQNPGLWVEAYKEVCSVLQRRGDAARVHDAVSAAAADFGLKAAACLDAAQGSEGSSIGEAAQLAEAWVRGACELACAAAAGAPAQSLPADTILALARVLLRAAKAASASTGGPDVAAARTAVYLALRRNGETAAADFLHDERVRASAVEELYRAPSELKVTFRDDDNSSDNWESLGLLPCGVGRAVALEVRCSWKDQCWGNRKGRIRAVLRRGAEDVWCEDLFGCCMDDGPRRDYVPAQRTLSATDQLVALARPGDTYAFEYVVGGGGGHELFIKDFIAKLSRQSLPSDIGSEEGFTSAVAMPPEWMTALLGLSTAL